MVELGAGLGAGAAGLFPQEYTAGAPHAAGWGRYAGGLWWGDVAWSFRSRLSVGLRAYLLRVPLEETRKIGTLDLFPCMIQVGYHHPGLTEHLRCFAAAGLGLAWTRFVPAGDDSLWEVTPELTGRRPVVFTILAGLNYELGNNFLAELGVSSVLMDTQIGYHRAPGSLTGDETRPELAYEVSGRHVLVSAGLRWWFEWW